jgi:hypothetical protein
MRNAALDHVATAATASAVLSLGVLAGAVVLASASPATTVVLLGLLAATLWAAVCTRAHVLRATARPAAGPAPRGTVDIRRSRATAAR